MFPSLGPMEMMVVMLVAVLLFGKRLPEVGRSLGKGIVEFKKGIRGIEDDFENGTPSRASSSSRRAEAYTPKDEPASNVPKFEPPSSAPVPASDYQPQTYQD